MPICQHPRVASLGPQIKQPRTAYYPVHSLPQSAVYDDAAPTSRRVPLLSLRFILLKVLKKGGLKAPFPSVDYLARAQTFSCVYFRSSARAT